MLRRADIESAGLKEVTMSATWFELTLKIKMNRRGKMVFIYIYIYIYWVLTKKVAKVFMRGPYYRSNARVVIPDITADNGAVHKISNVLKVKRFIITQAC